MTATIVNFFSSITHNDYLTLFIISIIPIIELRGAIVIMSGMTGINEIAGMFCCIAGSTIVIIPLILFIRPLIKKLKSSKCFSNLGKKLEANIADRAASVGINETDESTVDERNKKKWQMSLDAKKFWGLFLFVSVPLPLTGAWTGSCIGSFLNFKVWKAALAVFLGNVVAASMLTLVAVFLPQQYVDFFLYGFVILAIALAIVLYFAKIKRREQKVSAEISKYKSRNEYELALLKKEAEEHGEILIKKEYIDENGDRHIIIGKDVNKNNKYIDKNDPI